MASGLRRGRVVLMSYCTDCGALPHEQHLRICPHSPNPSEYVIADPAPAPAPPRRLSPVADGTQTALQRIAALRSLIAENTPSQSASVALSTPSTGDAASDATDDATGAVNASDDVGGLPHAI